jgi:TPR repeat protein
MKRTIALALGSLSAILAAAVPAGAGRTAEHVYAAQVRKGLAAFNRHDYTAAGALLRVPAEYGDSRAQAVLCFLYTYGRGVPQNYRLAADWCQRSAEQGNAQGQYMFGMLDNKGHGVPEDFVLAYKWLNLAAANASGPKRDYSYRIRDNVASKMSPEQIEKAQAIAWRPTPER